ncbi:CoA pyrophosphatase [Aquabacterium sp. OR-4]|uniref:CoA pyrophosphatase n=1 Tax=Aquabacterium sp. OR-4 TaxID=2978127 RepID=UPI0028C78700|nr:CoA pyrophosphatase [Aquabacterium sp. OR-4]MDT7836791.1 CoA pyrophosphatase [Aquabacterium sp. OR-4]
MAQPVPRITDPQAIPVIGIDDHLPPVAPAALTAPALRALFAAPPAFEPEIPGDGGRFAPGRAATPAAVLVPLVMRAHGLQVLLTQRTPHLRDHAGQVSFPGGRAEPHDADAVATALRETEEEVGLARRHIEVIGTLPVYRTVTSYVVTPVVGLVQPDFDLALDANEVAEAFEVPLAFLMAPANHHRHRFEWDGHARQFLSMPWTRPGGQAPYFIWGATAAMLRNLYGFLAGAR